MTTHFVLVPGFWLGGWAWDEVASDLRGRGHEVTAMTLPGLESVDSPRAEIRLEDHVHAIETALRASTADRTVLVAHSGAGVPAYMVTDRDPSLVDRVVYVDSGPVPDGMVLAEGLGDGVTEMPLPTWEELEQQGSSLAGLDEGALARFRERSVPEPAGVAGSPALLANPARYHVPTTVIASTFSTAVLQEMMTAGHPFAVEFRRMNADFIDLPTGHWPMWSKPSELAAAIDSVVPRV